MDYTTNTVTRLAGVIASRPGLTTKELYAKVGATSSGEQSFIRQELKRLTRSKKLSREKRPSAVGGAPTFAYFPGDKMTALLPDYQPQPQSFNGTTTTQSAPPVRKPRSDRSDLINQVLDAVMQSPSGIQTNDLYKRLGASTKSMQTLARRRLTELFEGGKVIRCVGRRKTGRGYPPYRYFPNTPEGRLAKQQYAAVNSNGTNAAGKDSAGNGRPRKTRSTGSFGTTGLAVEQIFRINMPSGNTEELTSADARKLYESLGKLFA